MKKSKTIILSDIHCGQSPSVIPDKAKVIYLKGNNNLNSKNKISMFSVNDILRQNHNLGK